MTHLNTIIVNLKHSITVGSFTPLPPFVVVNRWRTVNKSKEKREGSTYLVLEMLPHPPEGPARSCLFIVACVLELS